MPHLSTICPLAVTDRSRRVLSPGAESALGDQLLTAVARFNRYATRHTNLRIPSAQARLLAQIDALGPARIGDLAHSDHCSQPTMSAQAQRLVEQGWATRTPDPADGRASMVALTPAGSGLLVELRAARVATVLPLLDQLSEAERRRLQEGVNIIDMLLISASETNPKTT